nr:post-GPI attachment to proteins factor 2-like [Lytechinus pictus]
MMMLNDGRFSSSKGIHLTISRFITILMSIMVGGFFTSIGLALIYSFDKTTSTHCHVMALSIHENMFILFQVCSMVFMLLMCTVHKLAISSEIPPSRSEKKTLNWLYIYCATNISSFFIAIYFNFRHSSHCETGVYTLFAFFEYIVVLSNIAFHYIVTFNFQERELILGSRIHGKLDF